MTENTIDTTVSNSSWNLNNLLNNLTKERLIYLGIALVLVGAIIYYLKYVRKSEQLLNTNNNLQQPMMQQPLMQQPMMQQPMMQQPPMEYPKKIMMDVELFEDLKRRNMTPQDYIFELQKTGQFPPGPMPEIVIDNQNLKNNSQDMSKDLTHKDVSHRNLGNKDKSNRDNLKDLKIDEDEDEEEETSSDEEDDNLKNEDLSKEEMDNIKEHLLKLQKPSSK
jgi:hypothetical protein